MWQEIALDAEREGSLWKEALRSRGARDRVPVFSPLIDERFALAVETIYEGYLVHYGRSRLFAPADRDMALLLGDYLYAHGLVHVAETGDVAAVSDLAELISLCSQARAGGRDGDAPAWAATASALGAEVLDSARTALREHGDASLLEASARGAAGDPAVDAALAAHARHVG